MYTSMGGRATISRFLVTLTAESPQEPSGRVKRSSRVLQNNNGAFAFFVWRTPSSFRTRGAEDAASFTIIGQVV